MTVLKLIDNEFLAAKYFKKIDMLEAQIKARRVQE